MRGRAAVMIIVMLASVNLCWAIQSAVQAPLISPDWTSSIEHLTLNGALICAVIVLWKQLGKKDDLVIPNPPEVVAQLQEQHELELARRRRTRPVLGKTSAGARLSHAMEDRFHRSGRAANAQWVVRLGQETQGRNRFAYARPQRCTPS